MEAKRGVWLFQLLSEISLGSHLHHQPQVSCQGTENTGVGSLPFSRGPSRPRDRTGVFCSADDSSPAEPPGKPKNTGVGSLSLLQGTFPTQGSNRGLLQCGGSSPAEPPGKPHQPQKILKLGISGCDPATSISQSGFCGPFPFSV